MKVSRRAVVSLIAVPAVRGAAEHVLPSEWRKYLDASTEFEVVRLTSPSHQSVLPVPPSRAVNRKSNQLLLGSAREGSMQAFLLDLGNGQTRQLGTFKGLDPATLTFSADDRSVLGFDGLDLFAVATGTLRRQDLATVSDGWTRSGTLVSTEDGTSAFFAQSRGQEYQLARVRLPKGGSETILTHPNPILGATPNPKRAMVFWRTPAGELWAAAFDGTGKRRCETPAGRVLQAYWSPEGNSIFYLLEPDDKTQLVQIREQQLDSRADALVAKTSQFASFSRNANGSVFVGASRSKASPNVLLLLRVTRREFTLCEHRAKDPSSVDPVFTPNSQKVIFQSDREGANALYMMNVEKLIEKTDS